MLSIIGLIVVVLWIAGLIGHVGGGFINLLLVVGVIMLLVHFLSGRSARV